MDENERLEEERKRLIFRSWHRGTKEMDLILGSFANQHVPGFTEEQLEAYAAILKINDPDLYSWLTGKEDPPANMQSDVFEMLKEHQFASSPE